jgi:hypothetical protein
MVAAATDSCGIHRGNLVAQTYSKNTFILLSCSWGLDSVDNNVRRGIQEGDGRLHIKFGFGKGRDTGKR